MDIYWMNTSKIITEKNENYKNKEIISSNNLKHSLRTISIKPLDFNFYCHNLNNNLK